MSKAIKLPVPSTEASICQDESLVPRYAFISITTFRASVRLSSDVRRI